VRVPRSLITRIILSYDSMLVRAYCLARFRIIRQRFLEEIRQFLPLEGRVLELGCGFGLFGNFVAATCPGIELEGYDLDERRIAQATNSAERLGLRNARYAVADAREFTPDGPFAAAYMIDILHHVPPETVPRLLRDIYDSLEPNAVLIVKDVDTRPRMKMLFTLGLDVVMTKGEMPVYWSGRDMRGQLTSTGFRVFSHGMVDSLPYSHRLYVCVKGELPAVQGW
jgi:2-polyprenyl-3-methyl-5-hydroxy-6-metoxy-1,4-benzoquinol methylase